VVVDPVTRDVLQARMDRHRRAWWWVLLRRWRCRCCRYRWPCAAYLDADRVLRQPAEPPRFPWPPEATGGTGAAPLLTPGQEHRSGDAR
jgi:hypothetical protein